MPLPEHVFRVMKASGKVYYYHQPGRAGPKELRGALTPIRFDPKDPQFWTEAKRLNGEDTRPKEGTFGHLIAAYKDGHEWTNVHTEGTRTTYTVYIKVILAAWKDMAVDDLTVAGVIAQRDDIAETAPTSANMFVTVLRTILKWGINARKCSNNAARDIEQLDTEIEHAFPWPREIWQAVVSDAPADLSRMAFLGRVTGQRISDLVSMCPANIKGDVLAFQIKKLRNKMHRQPVGKADLAIIKSWGAEDLTPFITRADGRRHTPRSLRAALATWLGKRDDLRADEEILPHGLRAMAACDARLKGLTHEDISALYAMSVAMVKRYTHHIDQEMEARNARVKLDAG